MSTKQLVVDSHFHIWDLEKFSYPWPTAELTAIHKTFSLADYLEERNQTPVNTSIFVQSLNNCPEEARWLLAQAEHNPSIKGIVAGLDLTDSQLSDVLDELVKNPAFVGCRHIWPMETEDWILRDDVVKGLRLLRDKNLSYDLLLTPPLMKYIPLLAEKIPGLRMVVDHLAKPYIKDQKLTGWKEDLEKISKFSNIYCKISGLVVEADVTNWKPDDFIPYVQHTLDVFGPDRCMFGSDWPVCKMANADFSRVFQLAEQLVGHLSEDEKRKIFGLNAVKFYNLKI